MKPESAPMSRHPKSVAHSGAQFSPADSRESSLKPARNGRRRPVSEGPDPPPPAGAQPRRATRLSIVAYWRYGAVPAVWPAPCTREDQLLQGWFAMEPHSLSPRLHPGQSFGSLQRPQWKGMSAAADGAWIRLNGRAYAANQERNVYNEKAQQKNWWIAGFPLLDLT